MIEFHGLLKDLQAEVVALLAANAALVGPPVVDVLTEDAGDIDRKIEKAIGPLGSGGGVVIVSIPEPIAQDSRRPFMFGVTLTVQCLENAIINRSTTGNQIQSNRLGEIVHVLLNNYQSTAGWTRFQRVTWETGQTEGGNFGDRLVFTCETVYDNEVVTVDGGAVESTLYWGKSALTVLNEGQVLGLGSSAIVTSVGGTRAYSGGAGYLYFSCKNSLSPASMKIGIFPLAVAGPSSGYANSANGITYTTLTVSGETYRLYRSSYVINDAIDLIIT